MSIQFLVDFLYPGDLLGNINTMYKQLMVLLYVYNLICTSVYKWWLLKENFPNLIPNFGLLCLDCVYQNNCHHTLLCKMDTIYCEH